MPRNDMPFIKGLALFSGLASFVFVYFAMGILTAPDVPEWDRVFAYVTAGYGLGNVYILSAAWRGGGTWPIWVYKLIALCFFGVFLMDMWETGVESGLEYLGAVAVACVLWINWLAAKKITEMKMREK